MSNPTAWHNNPQLKADTVAAMVRDREVDAFVQTIYQRIDPTSAVGFRGCAIGCLVAVKRDPLQHPDLDSHAGLTTEPDPNGDSWHGEVERLFGIPHDLAQAIDDLFESLPTEDGAHARFAVEVIEAIPVGATYNDLRDAESVHDLHESALDNAAELIRALKAVPVAAYSGPPVSAGD